VSPLHIDISDTAGRRFVVSMWNFLGPFTLPSSHTTDHCQKFEPTGAISHNIHTDSSKHI